MCTGACHARRTCTLALVVTAVSSLLPCSLHAYAKKNRAFAKIAGVPFAANANPQLRVLRMAAAPMGSLGG